MAAVPFMSFSANKIHEQMRKEKEQNQKHFQREELVKVVNATPRTASQTFAMPPKYNDKLMNSIWGLYNRYAPPAFQRNFESSRATSEFAAPQAKAFGLLHWGRLN